MVMIIRFIIDGTKIEKRNNTKPFCNVGKEKNLFCKSECDRVENECYLLTKNERGTDIYTELTNLKRQI